MDFLYIFAPVDKISSDKACSLPLQQQSFL